MFSVGEKVVYPGHGVAVVNQVIHRMFGGSSTLLYELKFLNKDMTILVPIDNLTSIGIRQVSSPAVINALWQLLLEQVSINYSELVVATWNKRNKKYQTILRSGNMQEIARIYRELQSLGHAKELSFGERQLLAQVELLLAQEISLVEQVTVEEAIVRLRSCCCPSHVHTNTVRSYNTGL